MLYIGLSAHLQADTSTMVENVSTADHAIGLAANELDVTTDNTGDGFGNIESCQALIDKEDAKAKGESEDSESDNEGSEVDPLDLDKCRTMIK